MQYVAYNLQKLKDVPVKNKVLKKTLWFMSTGRNAMVVVICSTIAYNFDKFGPVPFKLSG